MSRIQTVPLENVNNRQKMWIESFINYHDGKHPILMGSLEVKSFLFYLAFTKHLPNEAVKYAYESVEYLYSIILGTTILPFDELI